jgi:hypothetical protein
MLSRPYEAIPIRNWHARFGDQVEDSTLVHAAKTLAARWWHRKDLLLWCQREMLATQFPNANPLAGRPDETPYDYDHICPQGDWATHGRNTHSMTKHCENYNSGIIGNSIGNFRLWDSSDNRSLQDTSAIEKLTPDDPRVLADSAVKPHETEGWRASSAFGGPTQGHWSKERAEAFQAVVEERSLRLFKEYYEGACLAEWLFVPEPETSTPS